MILVINNMFFSVIFDHYNTMITRTGSTVGMFWQMADSFSEMKYNCKRFGPRALCRRLVLPSHSALLDDFLGHVKANAEERRACQQGSIGLKLYRKKEADERAAHEK